MPFLLSESPIPRGRGFYWHCDERYSLVYSDSVINWRQNVSYKADMYSQLVIFEKAVGCNIHKTPISSTQPPSTADIIDSNKPDSAAAKFHGLVILRHQLAETPTSNGLTCRRTPGHIVSQQCPNLLACPCAASSISSESANASRPPSV